MCEVQLRRVAVLVDPLVEKIPREAAINEDLEVLPGLSQPILGSSIRYLSMLLCLVMHCGRQLRRQHLVGCQRLVLLLILMMMLAWIHSGELKH